MTTVEGVGKDGCLHCQQPSYSESVAHTEKSVRRLRNWGVRHGNRFSRSISLFPFIPDFMVSRI
jgi:uncharacterized membrane protein YdjX (TVP38/TMEM64 family)